jgi:3-oxoacyl-(acyl-carrier-protein) synthase
MRRRRVKITGIGPVTPAGVGKEPFWSGILEPVSRIRPFNGLGRQYGPVVAAFMDEFDLGKYADTTLVPNGAARHTQFAVAGTMLALRDAGLSVEELRGGKVAIVVGAALMDFGSITNSIESVDRHGIRGSKPRTMYAFNTASIAGAINQVLETSARTMAVQSSCCSGIDAIGFAADLVANGEVDIALCGGTEAPLYRFPLLELRAAGLTPTTGETPHKVDRPFDLWRTTGVVSEGACMFVLETEESPRPGYSHIAGYAFANDEKDDLCSGIATASRMALADAKLRPDDIEVINAWGPGHKLIDAGEVRAMRRVFGPSLPEIPAVSIKGAIGNPLGAAAAIQVAAGALGQRLGTIPPTVNWDFPDPDCPLNLSNRSRHLDHRVTMINAHGLAGVNSSFILERC